MGYVFKDGGQLFLVHCPSCDAENYAASVAEGQCLWCGYRAQESDVVEENLYELSDENNLDD